MVYIAPGLCTQGHDGGPPSSPRHTVQLGPYYIDEIEVTVGRYKQFRSAARANREPIVDDWANLNAPDDHPVVGVKFTDALRYVRWVGKELPTEAEWEKAARSPDGFDYPWGEGRPAWHRERKLTQIDPVRSFPADVSIYGVFDLAGNAREWCADWVTVHGLNCLKSRGFAERRGVFGPQTDSLDAKNP
jgi:formylglycine-generating enzyme required for sulfatase activity